MAYTRQARNRPQVQLGSGLGRHGKHPALHTGDDSVDRSYEIHVEEYTLSIMNGTIVSFMMDTRRRSLRFVPIRDQPVEDLVAQEPELATTRLAMCRDEPFPEATVVENDIELVEMPYNGVFALFDVGVRVPI